MSRDSLAVSRRPRIPDQVLQRELQLGQALQRHGPPVCFWCGRSLRIHVRRADADQATIDHFVPTSVGGPRWSCNEVWVLPVVVELLRDSLCRQSCDPPPSTAGRSEVPRVASIRSQNPSVSKIVP